MEPVGQVAWSLVLHYQHPSPIPLAPSLQSTPVRPSAPPPTLLEQPVVHPNTTITLAQPTELVTPTKYRR